MLSPLIAIDNINNMIYNQYKSYDFYEVQKLHTFIRQFKFVN